MEKYLLMIEPVLTILGAITVLATVIVKFTPTKTDDEVVSKFGKTFVKVMQWLPTIGINPRTKKLEETIMELREATNPGVALVNLNLILSLIAELVAAVKEMLRLKRVKEIKDAKTDAIEERDQRKLEEALGGSSGPVAPDKYPGLSVRERKADTPKKRKNEIWLVDGEQLVLFRVISDTKEQTLKIKDNPAMKRFMCVDKDEVDYWIEESDRE